MSQDREQAEEQNREEFIHHYLNNVWNNGLQGTGDHLFFDTAEVY